MSAPPAIGALFGARPAPVPASVPAAGMLSDPGCERAPPPGMGGVFKDCDREGEEVCAPGVRWCVGCDTGTILQKIIKKRLKMGMRIMKENKN